MYNIREADYPMRPRERLATLGEKYLSDQELLAILLRTGTAKSSVVELSGQILRHFETLENFRRSSIEELIQIPGIGMSKAIEIRAMMELGKRIQTAERERQGQVKGAQQFAMTLIDEMSDFDQEHLVAVYLDGKNKIIKKRTIFVGTVNSASANPREILHFAVKTLAAGILITHNHPSGDPKPSDADVVFTERMENACDNIGITLIDHIIVGHKRYFSFQESGLMF
ncbi:MAG: RadC family protein [Pseudolactococcus laudensis]|uniref:DNA repair protein RadC n=1 Tax=Pseudolactococcus laudensis TaxID=1494461 RepID=A0A7V8N137_9LACT|nr:DNA repair protein RadC [Lactococcus laudensis]MBA0016792.1 DNA repair protein RadC [Lactococcus laudensis]MBQ6144411.1 DNA repair protein RadC [Lactococcus sp.]MBR2763271.1 DNA repair protein RadC [Lactococcus sp.]MBW9281492.1 JAB domain-containing protein [Lactococcus laudensis]